MATVLDHPYRPVKPVSLSWAYTFQDSNGADTPTSNALGAGYVKRSAPSGSAWDGWSLWPYGQDITNPFIGVIMASFEEDGAPPVTTWSRSMGLTFTRTLSKVPIAVTFDLVTRDFGGTIISTAAQSLTIAADAEDTAPIDITVTGAFGDFLYVYIENFKLIIPWTA